MSGFRHKRTCGLFILLFFLFLHIGLVSAAGATTRIMPLGDSITRDDRKFDFRSDGEKIAYRYRLWQLLTDAGYDFDFVGNEYTGYDIFPGPEPDAENEGHPGWTDDDIAASVYDFLLDNPAQIILLHIGTNSLNPDPAGVENILDEIDRYEADFGIKITVILARIINRVPYSAMTTAYNDNVENMAFARVNEPANPAFPDNIIFGVNVDMEDGAGIEYRLLTDTPPGEMWDSLHPAKNGYSKMAGVWFTALMEILPLADAGPDQYVYEFDTVTLDAFGSMDPKGNNLSYQWVQTGGSTVALLDDQTAQATFDAPVVGPDGEILTFMVTVTDDDGLESTDAVDINILKDATNGFFYTPVTPCRIVDTRNTSAGTINASTQRDFHVLGSAADISAQGGNPAGCIPPLDEPLAAHINMVTVNPTGKGNLQAFPLGAGIGAGLSVNYNNIDTNLANAGTVKTISGAGADFTVASNFSSAHTAIDVLGYFYPDGDLLYTAVTPCRIVDTRKTSAGIIDASMQRDFQVHGSTSDISAQGGNPAGCSSPLGEPLAAHINMVAVNPTGKGNLQAFPLGAGIGAGLSVNYNTIDTNLANAGTVKTVTGGGADITVASNFSAAHTVIDVLGYYYPNGDLLYRAVTPCRIVDTRKMSAGIIDASTQQDFRVFGSGGTISAQGGNPAGCSSPLGQPLAAHINMVAVNPTGKGNLQAFPVGAGTGAGLSVNYNTIDTNLANAGTVKAITGTGPDITVASNYSSAHTVIDVLGYYYLAP